MGRRRAKNKGYVVGVGGKWVVGATLQRRKYGRRAGSKKGSDLCDDHHSVALLRHALHQERQHPALPLQLDVDLRHLFVIVGSRAREGVRAINNVRSRQVKSEVKIIKT
jgi:hypothetical protein